jgi:hypothetical protein
MENIKSLLGNLENCNVNINYRTHDLNEIGIIITTVIGVNGLSPLVANDKFNQIKSEIITNQKIKKHVKFLEERFYMSNEHSDVKTEITIV